METVIITCSECGAKLRLPQNKGILKVACPACKHVFEYDTNIFVPEVEEYTPLKRKVTITREKVFTGGAYAWTVLIDQKPVASLGNGASVSFEIDEKPHILCLLSQSVALCVVKPEQYVEIPVGNKPLNFICRRNSMFKGISIELINR